MANITSEDEAKIRALLASDDWKSVAAIINNMIEQYRDFCEQIKDDHRYHQGRVAALRDLLRYLNAVGEGQSRLVPFDTGNLPSEHFSASEFTKFY